MGQASCRVPDAVDDALQSAADEVGVFRSDVIRRALVYYIQTNPHDLEAFRAGSSPTSTDETGGYYDPMQDV